jgi:membrane protein implicated in regulation of membrane protease activity
MTWWAWALAACGLAALELVAPGWVFLGFALGAAALAAILGFGGPGAAAIAASWPVATLAFAFLSGGAWALLRGLLGVRRGQVRIWKRDIND